MFEISIIILSRLLLVAAGFLLYRKFNRWQGFQQTLIGRNGTSTLTTARSQRGYILLNSFIGKQAKLVKLNVGNRNLKTPWGW